MIRRLGIACVGFGAFMLQACTGMNKLSDPYYTGGGPGYVLMNRPGVPPGMYQQQGSDKKVASTKATAQTAEQRFGPSRTQRLRLSSRTGHPSLLWPTRNQR